QDLPAGSSKPQCSFFTLGGMTGQFSSASLQSVTTRSDCLKILLSIKSEVWFDMSISTTFIASIALGFTPCVSIPAEYTFHSSPCISLPSPQLFDYDKNYQYI